MKESEQSLRDFAKYTTLLTDEYIICEDKKAGSASEMTFYNLQREEVRKVLIDDGVIPKHHPTKRCDFLVIDARNTGHFVELKGQDVKGAIEQLRKSIELFHNKVEPKKYAFAICSEIDGGPRMTTRVQLSRAGFKTKYQTTLLVERSGYQHTLAVVA